MKKRYLDSCTKIILMLFSFTLLGINCKQNAEQKRHQVNLNTKADFVFIHYEYWDGRTFLIIGTDPKSIYNHFNIWHGYVFPPDVLILSPDAVSEISKFVSLHAIPSNQHLGSNIYYSITVLKKDNLIPLPNFFHKPNANHFTESTLAECFLFNQTQANAYFRKLVQDLYDKDLVLDAIRLGRSLNRNAYYVYDTTYSKRFL